MIQELTVHQAEKTESLLELIEKKEKRIVLRGSAGVGKTFMVNKLIEKFREKYKYGTVWVTAPTHKALRVLRDKVREQSYIEFATIHSALKLKRVITKTGEETFVKQKYNPKFPPLQGCVLLIVDEASMLSSEIVGWEEGSTNRLANKLGILEEIEFKNILTIFVGDGKQLNPVGEENSPIFKKNYPIIELTEIIRQGKDNPIIDLSMNIARINHKEESISKINKVKKLVDKLVDGYGYDDVDDEGKDISYVEKEIIEGFVYTNDRYKIIEKLASVNGTDEIKYIAWTNADVDAMNNDVRNKIYGSPKKIELDEIIVLNAPFLEHHTNDEIKILRIKEQIHNFIIPNENTEYSTTDGDLRIIESPMRDGSGNIIKDDKGNDVYPYDILPLKVYRVNDTLLILHEESETKFKDACKLVNSLCRGNMISWVLFYWLKECVLDFKYNHAITVHRAQGSTFEIAIINVGNLNMNKNVAEKKRLFYTAITRASELVVLYNVK